MRRHALGAFVALALAVAAGAHAEDLSGAAYSTCQMFALERLKTRATIHFPGLGERGTGARVPAGWDPGRYQVISFVDSRATTGVPLRRDVYCELIWLGQDRWSLRKLVIGELEQASVSRPRSAGGFPAARP